MCCCLQMTVEKQKACMYSSEARKGSQSCWQMAPEEVWAENMDVQQYAEAEEVQWLHWLLKETGGQAALMN